MNGTSGACPTCLSSGRSGAPRAPRSAYVIRRSGRLAPPRRTECYALRSNVRPRSRSEHVTFRCRECVLPSRRSGRGKAASCSRLWATSDALDADAVGVRRECSEILNITGEDDASRLGTGNDDGVDCGATAGAVAEFACAASKRHRQFLADVAGLEQPVHCGVIALTSRDRLDKDDGRNQRWPRSVSDKRADGGDCIPVPLGEETHSAGVEEEHPQLALDDPAFPPRKRWASRSARATDADEGSPTSSTSSDR